MLEKLNYSIRIGSTTFLYFDLYLYSAYVVHYVYYINISLYLHFYSFLIGRKVLAWQAVNRDVYCVTPDSGK